jgi:hypothetical protein
MKFGRADPWPLAGANANPYLILPNTSFSADLYRPSATHQLKDKHNERDDEQNVDIPRDYVETDETNSPED